MRSLSRPEKLIYGALAVALPLVGGELWWLHAKRQERQFIRLVYQLQITREECDRAASEVEEVWRILGPERVLGELGSGSTRSEYFARAKEAFRLIDPSLAAARSRPREEQDLVVDMFATVQRLCEKTKNPIGESLFTFGQLRQRTEEDFDHRAARLRFLLRIPPRPQTTIVRDYQAAIAKAGNAALPTAASPSTP